MGTNREWIEQTLAHDAGAGVPYNFMLSPPAMRRVRSYYGKDWETAIGAPLRMSGPGSIKPLYADPAIYGEVIRDEFGVAWSTSPIDRGSPIGPCLKAPDLSDYTFPDPAAPCRFGALDAWCREQEGHYRILWVGDLWERATFMRGMEPLLLDVALNRPFVEALLDRLTLHIRRTMEILLSRFPFEAIAVSDDYGAQDAMLISPDDWRSLIKPRLAAIYGMAHDHDRAVFHHTCGHVVPIIGDLIDIGLDILHPIQPEAMDILHLKREFGRDLTFCGGVPTQDLLVTGTPAQVRDEVRRLKHDMGADGGYILEPGITLQDDVPLENMIAMIDEAMAGR